MLPDNDRRYIRLKKTTLLVIALVLGAGLIGWLLGRSDDSQDIQVNTPQSSTTAPVSRNNTGGLDVRTLANYTLPFNWGEASCPAEPGSVFVVPSGGSEVDCNVNNPVSNFISPVKISVDPANTKDCNQLQNIQDVSKHICISVFINGLKSLKAETVYNKNSPYKRDTAINAYYIDTGKGMVKVEYFHSPNDKEHQIGFDQLANSFKSKN